MQNRSVIDEIRADRILLTDTTMPLMSIAYSPKSIAGEDPNTITNYHTITIALGGSSTSKLLVTVKIGKGNGTTGGPGTNLSTAASTTYEFSASGVEVATGATEATTTTLGALIDALNAIDGVSAVRLNAPADYSLDTNDFAALAETDIPIKPMTCLYKDASEIYTTAIRIGNPEAQDSGRMKLLGIAGTLTGATGGTVKVSRDPTDGAGGASDETPLLEFALVNSTRTEYLNGGYGYSLDDAPTFRGPLLIEVTSSDLSVCDIVVRTAQAEW